MTNKILNLVFKAKDEASPTLKQIEGGEGRGGIGGVTAALKGLINPATIAAGAFGTLSAKVIESANDWKDYSLEVGNLAGSLNMTAEDASNLMSVMERFNITNDTAVAVFRKMNREGMAPTMENLQNLLYHYDDITDATEKMQFAQEYFGEQGLKQIIPMWDRLTEAQKENFLSQEQGIKITEENIKAARELEAAQKTLEVATRKVGGAVVMYWHNSTKAADAIRELIGLQPILNENKEEEWKVTEKVTAGSELYVEWLKKERGIIDELSTSYEDLTEKELRKMQIDAILAGDLSLATALGKQIDALETQNQQLETLIDYLDQLDGKQITSDVYIKYHGVGKQHKGGPPGVEVVNGRTTTPRTEGRTGTIGGYATGGSFVVSGAGGVDSQLVQFMATPGEKVNVEKNGENTNEKILFEVRRLVNSLPTLLRDAMERV